MKKKHIAIIILMCLVIISLLLCFNTIIGNKGPQAYLAKKYGINQEEIIIVKYEKNHFITDFGFLGLDSSNTISYKDRKWICEYNGKQFHAEYYLFKFMDDYQLEDIFMWCTEYLQENFDKDIVGVDIFSETLYHSPSYSYDYILPWDNNKIFSKKDSEKILSIQTENIETNIYYLVDNLNDYGTKSVATNFYVPNDKYYEFIKDKERTFPFTFQFKSTLISNARFERVVYMYYPNEIEDGNSTKYSLAEKYFYQKICD